jgi:hypothetical protein
MRTNRSAGFRAIFHHSLETGAAMSGALPLNARPYLFFLRSNLV